MNIQKCLKIFKYRLINLVLLDLVQQIKKIIVFILAEIIYFIQLNIHQLKSKRVIQLVSIIILKCHY